MTNSEYDKFFEHEHDGIREYDNPLPGWWKWLFVLSIFYSVGYYVYYHIGVGDSIHDNYDASVVAHLERQLADLGEIAGDDLTIVRLLEEKPDMVSAVGSMFAGNCAQCHKPDGGGDVGPNLTDDYWKNVKTPEDIFDVIKNGVPNTTMPAWGERLREPQMILLAAYVASLRGTEPAAAKEPEGDRIDPWPTLESLAPPDGDAERAEGAAPE